MNEFLTLDMLSTYAGAVIAVTLVTELIKDIPFLKAIPTRLVSYTVAVVLMLGSMVLTKGFTWGGLFLVSVNAVIVALSANGAYDGIKSGMTKLGDKEAAEPPDEEEFGEEDGDGV